MPIWFKYAVTAGLVVLISELAKRSDRVGAFIGALPWTTTLVMVWLFVEKAGSEKIGNHAWYTFWYVLPTMPMFLLLPWLLQRGCGFRRRWGPRGGLDGDLLWRARIGGAALWGLSCGSGGFQPLLDSSSALMKSFFLSLSLALPMICLANSDWYTRVTLGPLKLGIAESEIVASLGEPEEESKPQLEGATGLYVSQWSWPKQGVVATFASETETGVRVVDRLQLTAPATFKTAAEGSESDPPLTKFSPCTARNSIPKRRRRKTPSCLAVSSAG